jgi:hypothetical protein
MWFSAALREVTPIWSGALAVVIGWLFARLVRRGRRCQRFGKGTITRFI